MHGFFDAMKEVFQKFEQALKDPSYEFDEECCAALKAEIEKMLKGIEEDNEQVDKKGRSKWEKPMSASRKGNLMKKIFGGKRDNPKPGESTDVDGILNKIKEKCCKACKLKRKKEQEERERRAKESENSAANDGSNPTPPASSGNTSSAKRGNELHYDQQNGGTGSALPTELNNKYPHTDFSHSRRGEKGADVEVVVGADPWDKSVYPDTTWEPGKKPADFKPDTPSGHQTFRDDIRKGKRTTPQNLDRVLS